MIGQVIGNYRIVSELGKGGMGMVYRAEHIQLGKPAALKMLLPQLSSDPAIVQRFFNEARAASAIQHPGIVDVFDFGTHTDGAAYIVMEMLRGESLEQRLQRGPLAPLDGASIVAQVLGALAAAHEKGIIHRDLKPDNIFLTPNELMPGGIQVKLLDFGIAKLGDDKHGGGFKTQTGMMMGTPAYMSPEQCMGSPTLDHRTDLYAVGCILYHVLTGRPPFVSDQGTGMMIAAHIRDIPDPPRAFNPHVPDALAAITLRLLEKEPAARFQTALETRQALVAAGAHTPSKPPAPIDQYGATMAPTPSMAKMIQSAPTTASGSAAQVMPTVPVSPRARRGKGGLIAAIALGAAALAGVGVWAAMRSSGSADKAPTQTANATAPTPPAAGTPPTPNLAGAPVDIPPAPPSRPVANPESGSAGAPMSRPPIATSTQPPPHGGSVPPPPPPKPPVPGTSAAPTFTLDAKVYAPGDTIQLKFAAPVASPDSNKAWVTVVEPSKAPSQYGAWTYIVDGATTATLPAPEQPGAYEIRMHTDYPTKSFNVRHTVAVRVDANASVKSPTAKGATPRGDQRFMLATKVAKPGEQVEVTFPVALKAADGEKFWITVVVKGAADSAYGAYAYVPDGARQMQVEMPDTTGDYEIRLHANYPRLSTNLVHRAAIRVEE